MDIPSPVLATLIALIRLALSIHTSITTRRASQLQRLTAIRTKLSALMWKMDFDLNQYERCTKKLDQFFVDEESTLEQDVSFLKESKVAVGGIKSSLDSVASKLSIFPISLGAGEIEEIEHGVDTITQGVELFSDRLLPRMLKLVERIESLPDEKLSKLANPSIITDAVR